MTDYDDEAYLEEQMERQDQEWLDEVRDKRHLDRMWVRIKGEAAKAINDTRTVIEAEEGEGC